MVSLHAKPLRLQLLVSAHLFARVFRLLFVFLLFLGFVCANSQGDAF